MKNWFRCWFVHQEENDGRDVLSSSTLDAAIDYVSGRDQDLFPEFTREAKVYVRSLDDAVTQWIVNGRIVPRYFAKRAVDSDFFGSEK